MDYLQNKMIEFKNKFEDAIISGGMAGKTSIIRSSSLINLVHDSVKEQLIRYGVDPHLIYPRLNETTPEIKISGFLKRKDQDVVVTPRGIKHQPVEINWGPLSYEGITDEYGMEFSSRMLVINVRSQMSSIDKNSDTLFERTFAEALNLHLRYNSMVLGEVYLIPTHEYSDESAKLNRIGFKSKRVNLEKYISFFTAMNNRQFKDGYDDDYRYERVALLIVDFNRETPKIYSSTQELKNDGLLREDFMLEYENLNFQTFSQDILKVYSDRFDINLIMNTI